MPAVEQLINTVEKQSQLEVNFISIGFAVAEGPEVAGTLEKSAVASPGAAESCECGAPADGRLPAQIETTVYRVVQEALTNVVRHAQARRAGVILERRHDTVVAIIEDDGIGFDPEEAARRNRLGVLGMRERAEMTGGTLTVESAPASGTTIFLEIPCVIP